ncbi:MAG TPA: hypothetical protein VEG63_00715 [Candidatus Acidoferrales bacterium]|nr:hypothetical protein [Candidatus Acidoferrales bacterium]
MGKLCLALIACWLALAVSTPARQAEPRELMAAGNLLPSESQLAEADEQQPSGDAQTQAQPQPQPQQGEQKPAEPEKKPPEQPLQNGISKDRLFYLLPNFLTLENASNVPPLTSGQKFKAVARGTFDPVQFCYYVVIAGIGQAADNEPGYGQGMQGYGKRFGAIVADSTIENFMVGAVMPSLLRQDPRYFQAGKGPVLHRVWYALTRIFVTRGDDGHRQFNASEIFGSAMAAGISTYSYHPEADRGFRNLGDTWATQVGLDSFANAMKEFWPDIRRHFHKKGAAAADTKTPGR